MGSVFSTLNSLANQLFHLLSQIAFLRYGQEPKSMHWNSLPAKVVVDIFSRMTPTELLATERVDRNWQRLVRETLEGRVETVEIGAEDHVYIWNVCHHKKDTRKTLSLEKMFYYIFNEKRMIMEEALGREYWDVAFIEGLQTPQGMQLLTSCLSKLRGVQSIDLRELKISVQALVKVFELCPKLDCLTINGRLLLDLEEINESGEDKWSNFVRTFGHRLVHLFCNSKNCERLLQLFGRYSSNLELFCLYLYILTEEIVATIKQLQQPKNANVRITFFEIENVSTSLDFIDEIIAGDFIWNLLPDNCQRLSMLRFRTLQPESDSLDQFKSIEFSNLKHLNFKVTEFKLRVLIGCRYPLIKELKLNFDDEEVADIDQLLGQLFERMPILVKINFDQYLCDIQHHVPGPSILRINHLEEIIWRVLIRSNWNCQMIIDSLDVIGQVPELKMFTFNHAITSYEMEKQWQEAIDQRLALLKERRPDLVLVIYNYIKT